MKKYFLHLVLLIIGCGLFACKKEFIRVNTNPNNLEQADPTSLLSNIEVQLFYNNAFIAWTLGNGYSQYMTFSQDYYNTATRYSPVTNEPYWDPLYESARDANILFQTGQQQHNPFMQAIALTLRAYAFAQLTECWGDIPFKQALQGASGSYTPSYDAQQTVYTDADMGIIPSLQRADSLLMQSVKGEINGDILYQGDPMKWRKLVNALRLRYLLRVSSKTDVRSAIQSLAAEGVWMTNANESAAIDLPASLPYNFPSLTERSGDYQVKFMNSTLYTAFVKTQDSFRIRAYFAPNALSSTQANFSFSNYGGMPLVVNATTDQVNTSSIFNPANFRAVGNPKIIRARIMTYAEQQFGLAEAILKGYLAGNASDAYTQGILGAFAEIGLSSSDANLYAQHPQVVLSNNSDTAMYQIILQKWLANINNGLEGWIEFKRTGYPNFNTGGSVNLNQGKIPNRFLYPVSEATINANHYQAELQKMGGHDDTNYRPWW